MTVNQSEPVNEAEVPSSAQPVTESPGTLIRRAREAAGLSQRELSTRMCFIGDKLTYLENDDYARLPAPLYVKGYIRNICKELKIDDAPILKAYSGFCGEEEENPAILDHVQRDAGPVAGGGRRTLPGVALVLLVAGAGAFWWVNGQGVSAPSIVSAEPAAAADEVAAAESEPAHAAFVGDDVDLTPAASDLAGTESGSEVEEAGEATAEAPAEARSEVSTDTRLPATTEAAAQRPEGVPADTAPVAQAEVAADAESPAMAEPEPAPAPVDQSAPTGESQTVGTAVAAAEEAAAARARLQLSFAEEAWIEVQDANGSVLVAKLQPAGSGVDLSGEPPFKVMLGNAAATEVRYEGQLVDSSPLGNRRTRRLTVGD